MRFPQIFHVPVPWPGSVPSPLNMGAPAFFLWGRESTHNIAPPHSPHSAAKPLAALQGRLCLHSRVAGRMFTCWNPPILWGTPWGQRGGQFWPPHPLPLASVWRGLGTFSLFTTGLTDQPQTIVGGGKSPGAGGLVVCHFGLSFAPGRLLRFGGWHQGSS